MKKDKSEIILVIDRSGSMKSVKEEAENGIKLFIEEQKKAGGEANLTLIDFDTEYRVVHDGVNLANDIEYQLVPRGMTALLDAVGKAINTVGDRLANTNEDERPEHVIMLVVTDGEENSSNEFTKAQIKEMIEHQRNKYNWQFSFIGADENAFANAQNIGFFATQIAVCDTNNYVGTYAAASTSVLRARSGGDAAWTLQERDLMKA